MTMHRPPLSVLDLSPVAEGGDGTAAIAQTIALAQHAETLGYARYWLGEHHVDSGIAGTNPLLLAAIVASRTSRIRVGSAATIVNNHSPIHIAEAALLLAKVFPDRIDLGLARFGGSAEIGAQSGARPDFTDLTTTLESLLGILSRRDKRTSALFAGDAAEGNHGLEIWLHGSSTGATGQLAAEQGLRFGANYHASGLSPARVVGDYRRAFRPSIFSPTARSIISVDLLVADSDELAERHAAGYVAWLASIASPSGMIPYPHPDRVPLHTVPESRKEQLAARQAARIVGTAEAVTSRLEALAREIGADEIVVTTTAHDADIRRRSYQLLAEAWRLEPATPVDPGTERA